MTDKQPETEDVPLLLNHDHLDMVGYVRLPKGLITEDSRFEIGYIKQNDGSIELLEISICT